MKRYVLVLVMVLALAAPALACQPYHDVVQDRTGKVIPGASITVNISGTSTPATIFSDSLCAVSRANPVTTSSDGSFTFYANDGRYDIIPSKTGYLFTTISDISIFDPLGENIVTVANYRGTDICALGIGAIDQIGANQRTLVINKPVTCSISKTVPATLTIQMQGRGLITLNSGAVLTLNSPANLLSPGAVQVVSCTGTEACLQFLNGGLVYVDWWGTDGSNDHVQINQAISSVSAAARLKVLFAKNSYNAAGTITIDGKEFLTLTGAAATGTIIVSQITGAASSPLVSITGSSQWITFENIDFQGNNQTGASGNGHAFYLNGAGASPFLQYIHWRDCRITGFLGTGKDRTGSSILASGIYATESHSLEIEHSQFLTNQYGVYFDGDNGSEATRVFKVNITKGTTFDGHKKNGMYCYWCEGITIDGESLFNNNGEGNASEGNIRLNAVNKFTIHDARLKDGNPWEITTNGAQGVKTLNVTDNEVQHFVNNAMFRFDSGVENLRFEGNHMQWIVPDVTSGNGILIDQGYAGGSAYGFRIVGNRFESSNGLTVDNAIDVNVTTNAVRGLVIESNVFGEPSLNGGGTDVITTAINLRSGGAIEGTFIRGNTIGFSSGGTVTTGIYIGANAVDTILFPNYFIGTVGTDIDDNGTTTTSYP